MSFCRNCGRELPEGAAFCSGCGQSTGAVSLPVHEHGVNGMAIAGFIAAFLFPIAGIVLSGIGLSYAKKGDYATPLKELAVWGLIVAIVHTVLNIVVAVVTTLFSISMMNWVFENIGKDFELVIETLPPIFN